MPTQRDNLIPTEVMAGRLKAARELAGLSRTDAARQLGIAPGTLAQYEGGDKPQDPSFRRVLRMVQELGYNPRILAPEFFLDSSE